ncbi:plasmid pRiA4b ORF-3 family protein [Sciscionella marina]|uniref:plasmid pRiA4b ORF-3 family protein n=1 Tax=Sciscionella marina TaxID=508770 RepID=UPI000476FAE3|nr:plasmid pRiA4b ORF-3 family protein [Sciscionella marina]
MARSRVTATMKIFRIEIVLVDVEPLVRRVVEVPGEASLGLLHEVVQEAMGWENAHLHEFEIDGLRYGMPDPDWDSDVLDEAVTKLFGVLAAGQNAGYVYDFGDNWHHVLVVDAVATPGPGVRYPRCVAGEGACPPEDVGGVFGYPEFVDALADPRHAEHDERVEWWGSDRFDPHHFDLAAADRALARLAWTPLAGASSTARS